MRNVTAGVGKYNLEEIRQEFRSPVNLTDKNYILLKTVVGTKVYLLLGVKMHKFNLYLSEFSLLE